MSSVQNGSAKANRLAREKSPYLLQHAYNPVEWYAWGEEALAKAKREDKPIFLSIGYSTCYWCHVMEKESFESPHVAGLLNRDFVAIKVDREERPDLDAIYMNAVVALTGQGGWPMSIFLTPDGKPFWGGTYFPPEDSYGRPGFKRLLALVADGWKNRRDEILKSSTDLSRLIGQDAASGARGALSQDILTQAAQHFAARFDSTFGGFGEAPKFPSCHSISFLLRVWARTKDAEMLSMVEHSLDFMARGGIHDQLGGGFHRYSTDQRWLVPHFEKMLYDQAMAARAYLEAYQATQKQAYADVARDILDYVLRDLTGADGGFYSAEDAGEVGKEGEFYVWRPAEVQEVLGEKEAELFNRYYDVSPGGNFEHGTSILHIAQPLEAFSKVEGLAVDEAGTRLRAAREKMLAARGRRTRPHLDDKILTDWNGLMIGALALGAQALGDARYLDGARRAEAFLASKLSRDGHLLHRYRDGEAAIPAYLDDYAYLAWGLLELYGATFDVKYLAQAQQLAREMIDLFWDSKNGGFFMTGARNEPLIARTKELHDGAMPSGNSVAALVLVRLGILTQDRDFLAHAEKTFEAFSGQISQIPTGFSQMLIAYDFFLGPSQEIVIAGDAEADATQEMLRAVRGRFLPRALLVLHASGSGAQDLEALVPFVKDQKPLAGKTTAYVCQNYTCSLPTSDLARMLSLLD